MKAESIEILKTVNQLAETLCGGNEENTNLLRDCMNQVLKNEVGVKKVKLNLYNYIEKDKKSPRENLKGVFHDNGYKVATDSHILVALNESYDESLEGKVVRKDGTFIDCVYPKWRMVIPQAFDEYAEVTMDFNKLDEAVIKAKENDKTLKEFSKCHYAKLGTVYFNLNQLKLLADFMKAIGTDKILVHAKKASYTEGNLSYGVLMPVHPREEIEADLVL